MKIRVKPIPPNFDKKDWLVTPSLLVKDQWQGDLKNVKVGDVLDRKIYRKAETTVSELIPPIVWDTISGVSFYPERAIVNNNKTKTTFNADRTDAMRYLFEREGEVIIPEMTLFWWNAQRKKIYKKTLPEIVVNVQPNPDLGMLASIKDSLAAIEATTEVHSQDDAKKSFSFLGLNWWQLLLLIIALGYATPRLYGLLKKWIVASKEKRAAYLNSELHFFRLFLASLNKSETERMNAFYRWVDCFESSNPSYEGFLKTVEIHESNFSLSKSEWKKRRKFFLEGNKLNREVWINP
jgi:hypothetical protein